MIDGDIAAASRPSRILTTTSVALWAILALLLPLSALTLNAFHVGRTPLGFWVAAQGVFGGLALLALFYSWRAGGQPAGGYVRSALVFAGEAVGAAVILGFSGAIAALGYDGLALPLGLVAGFTLLVILVASRFVLYPVRSISGFFDLRFGGETARRLASVITLAATILLLAADVRVGARALQSLAQIDFRGALIGLTLATGLVWVVGSFLTFRRVAGLGFVLVLTGLFVGIFGLAANSGGAVWPGFGLGSALSDHAELNQKLVVAHLSDVKSLTPMTSPFLLFSQRNFAGLLLAVALGFVAAPHLLGRHLSQAAVAPGSAVRKSAIALSAVAIVVLSLAPLAIYSRIGFEQILVKGIEIAAIPQSFADASHLGLLKVCDQASTAVADMATACGKVSGQRGFVRLQDIAFSGDGFLPAVPLLSGLDPAYGYPLMLSVVLAALLAGNALVSGIVEADAEIRGRKSGRDVKLDVRAFVLGSTTLFAAATTALVLKVESGLLAAEGFALLAAGIFPALLLGLHWRRMSAIGAILAMVAGTIVAVVYLLGVRFAPVELFRYSGALSDAGTGPAQRFADLDAAWQTASDPVVRQAARATLELHATGIANWFGLKPAAIVLIAVPLGFAIGIVASLLSRTPPSRPERT